MQILLIPACPLMMRFCMKGMFSGHKNIKVDHQPISATELHDLQIKMADLIEQNHSLMKDIEFLKEEKPSTTVMKEILKRKTRYPCNE